MNYNYEESLSDLDALEEYIPKLTDDRLKGIANSAQENFLQISIILALPHFLMSESVKSMKQIQYTLEGAVKTKNFLQPKSEEGKKQLDDYVRAKFEENKKSHSEEGSKLLRDLRDKVPQIENGIRTLALNSLVNIWTIFESTSKDIWIYLLNNYQDKFLNNILESKIGDEVEGVTGKFISISLLGKYGFNVNNRLGEILSSKYDFTSCSGIKKAFIDLDRTKKEFFNFLNDDNLVQLEILRNLIVHKAGVVDEVYLKRTSIPNLTIGQKVAIDIKGYSNFENSTIHSLIKLLQISEEVKNTTNQLDNTKI
jgi:hypothetical protein